MSSVERYGAVLSLGRDLAVPETFTRQPAKCRSQAQDNNGSRASCAGTGSNSGHARGGDRSGNLSGSGHENSKSNSDGGGKGFTPPLLVRHTWRELSPPRGGIWSP